MVCLLFSASLQNIAIFSVDLKDVVLKAESGRKQVHTVLNMHDVVTEKVVKLIFNL